MDVSYFLQQPLGSDNEPDSSKRLEIHLNMSTTAQLNVLPCRDQPFHRSAQGCFSWSLQCKAERCSLESFPCEHLNFNQRRAEGSVTHCAATQRNWQRRTKCSTAKTQSEHRQINFCLQSYILIHLQRSAHIYYTSTLVKINKDNSSVLCRMRNIF